MPSSTYLDRSSSVYSNASSTSSSASSSLHPITPSMLPQSSFPSPQTDSMSPVLHPIEKLPRPLPSTPLHNNNNSNVNKGSIGNLAAYGRSSPVTGEETGTKRSSWTPGHRSSAATVSQDVGGRTFAASGRSTSLRTGLLAREEPGKSVGGAGGKVAEWRSGSTPPPSTARTPTSASIASPSAQYQPQSPLSFSPSSSSFHHDAPRSPATPTQTNSDRILSSSIFSSRDPAIPHSPQGLGLQRNGSFARSHRRAMTLPQLGEMGLPVPPVEEEVVGLPGRTRLSRPAEINSPFAPSAVFSSSHGGLNRTATGGIPTTPTLLPSQTVRAMDRQRHDLVAYEYLCHVAETKEWLNSCINRKVTESDSPLWGDSIGVFEQSLRNGYALAHLARSLGGKECQGPIFNHPKLQYRHIDNIMIFFQFVTSVGLPEIFRFETNDLYNAKNLPKVIYCLHALSHVLARKGLTQRMTNLVGQIDFTDDEVRATKDGLDGAGVKMPNFGGIGKALAKTIHEEPEEIPETEEERQDRELNEARPQIVRFQACCRGALSRRDYSYILDQERQRQAEVERIRLAEEVERVRLEREVREAARTIVGFQAVVRGALVRRRFFSTIDQLDLNEGVYTQFQSAARGVLARRRYEALLGNLGEAVMDFVGVQAVVRGVLARQRLLKRARKFQSMDGIVVGLQAYTRGYLARRDYANRSQNLRKVDVVRSVGGLQSFARAALVRRRVQVQKQELGFVEPDVVGIQAQTRGWMGRCAFLDWREHIYNSHEEIVTLQSISRGMLARRRYDATRLHFHLNMGKVIKLQAAIRSRQQETQYRQLRAGVNVPVNTLKNFVHLLDDSEFDYADELRIGAMRKELVQAIRETQSLEDDVKDLDKKIALLVKNKITHEVARASRSATTRLAPSQRNDLLSAASDPFANSSLDQQTARKLELYQQLFWHLQTSPSYLARLFANSTRLGLSEKLQKTVEATAFVVFGYAQNTREEYLLLKLFQRSIEEEMKYLSHVGEFAKGNFGFIRLFLQYGRGVTQKGYLRQALGPQIVTVNEKANLDLRTDPIAIYRAEVAKEETRTGVASMRPLDVTFLEALRDPDTKATFVDHVKALRAATDGMLKAMYESLNAMPFGIRYFAREVYNGLQIRFPKEPEEDIIRIVGYLMYYRFIQPAVVAPETYDIVKGVLPPTQRKNLAEVCKLMNQIAAGRVFHQSDDEPYLQPLNEFVVASTARFTAWVRQVISVVDAEVQLRAGEYIDAASARRPTIWISPNDIYAIHSVLVENVDVIVPESSDPLRAILSELGRVPSSNTTELSRARADEVALELATRHVTKEDPNADSKALFNQAKRRVLAILKVHHGSDLEAVLVKPVTAEDEDSWAVIVEEERQEERRQVLERRHTAVPLLNDIRSLTFTQLKQQTLQDILKLRQVGLVDRADKYQAILNAIAMDIRLKHHRRLQRQHELATLRDTLASLRSKKEYVQEQISSYHVYIDQSMTSIQKKSKRRLVLPWSLQAHHQRDLEKAGKTYQFGSYKYTAQTLYDRGILLSIDQYSPKQFDKISLTISSNEVGVFEVSASYLGLSVADVVLTLEDLLDKQFNGKATLSIDGVAKVNLNLLLNLINRKFGG